MRRDKEAEAAFSRYVTDLRTKQNITLEKLCEGLCTPSNLLYLETGKKGLSKHLQDRILERLGVGAEDFSYMLGYEEYDCWHLRTKVLYAICQGECDRARELLQMYVETYGDENPLERQFYLRMKAMILQYEQGDSGEIHALLEEALKLTVPAIDTKKISDLILSIQELDMLADRAKYSGKEEEATYLTIIEYTRHRAFDSRGVSKILPKAVVYLYEEKRKNGIENLSTREQMELLNLLSDAQEIQRDNCSLYYLWEILSYRNELFHLLDGTLKIGQAEYVQNKQDNAKWLETIEWMYNVTGFYKETREFSNVYFVKGVECVNDVIRTRRKMLGMSATQLCEGICDVRTLRRIEKRKGTPQRLLAGELLERLRLPKEYVKNDMVVQEAEEKRMVEELARTLAIFQYDIAEELVRKIKEKDLVKSFYNRQYLYGLENILLLCKSSITKQEFCENEKKILGLTVPWEILSGAGERYLSHNEIRYIHNYILRGNSETDDYWKSIRILEQYYCPFYDTEFESVFASQIEFAMDCVQSELGNSGDYLKSNKYGHQMIVELIRAKRLYMMSSTIYSLWWNHKEQFKENSVSCMKKDVEILGKCSALASLCKNTAKERFYVRKINEI